MKPALSRFAAIPAAAVLSFTGSAYDSAHAQVVRGIVVDSVSRKPVHGAAVTLSTPGARRVIQVFTGPDGLFTFDATADPPFDLHVQRFGYRSTNLRVVGTGISDTDTLDTRVAMQAEALSLPAIAVAWEPPHGMYVGPEGLFLHQKCFYAVVDNVLYLDPFAGWEMLNRYLALQYLPDHLGGGLKVGGRMLSGDNRLENHMVPDSTTRRILYPCGGKFVLTDRTNGRDLYTIETIVGRDSARKIP